nr:targeting protein for Xklp2-like isoform X2 [Procambarus clarkii]
MGPELNMARTCDDSYEFNAPKHYFDLNAEDNEVDESYFDCPKSAEIIKEEGNFRRKPNAPDTPSLASTTEVPSAPAEPSPASTMEVPSAPAEPSLATTVEVPSAPAESSPASTMEVPSTPAEPSPASTTEIPNVPAAPSPASTAEIPSAPAAPSPATTAEIPNVPAGPLHATMETPVRPRVVSQSTRDRDPDPENKENINGNSVKSNKSVKRRKSLAGRTSSVGVRYSPRLAAIAKAIRRSSASRQSLGKSSPHEFEKNKVHKTRTHKQSVSKVTGVQGLSPEDKIDLEKIATFRQKMADNKKKTATKPLEFHFATDSRLRNQKKAEPEIKEPKTQGSSKPGKLERTVPQEFHFATDSRIKNQDHTEEETVDFTKSLRSGTAADNTEARKGPTIPQPFNLTESRKGKTEEGNKFVSVAELNLKFHTKTPQRFRSKRAGSNDDLNQEGRKKPNPGVTIPHTPNFCTRSRSRQVNYLTHEEMEQKAFEEAQRHVFKAHPVNKKVLEAPAGYHVEKKVPTVPEPFDITDSKRVHPINLKFQEMCNKLSESALSVASLPHGGIPSKWDKTSTTIQPFSFDSRDKTKQQRKLENIQKILEEEKKLAEFHAQPMPYFESGVRGVPTKKPPTPTKPQPFALKIDERAVTKQEQFQKCLLEEARLDKEKRKFRARSDAVLHKEPFIPEKSKKPLTDISTFALNTEVRAIDRNEYELHRKRKEDEILAAKREQEERQAAEELAEVARVRREAVHKANPVRKYKPVVIDHSQNVPTVPISPNFATESRLRGRSRPGSVNSTMDSTSRTFVAE